MAIFAESQWVWIVTGIFLLILTYCIYGNNKNVKVLAGMLVLTVMTVGLGLVFERWIETDREKITTTLDSIAAELMANNIEGIEKYLAPDAEYLRNLAAAGMVLAKINTANVSNIRVEFNDMTSNRTAKVMFTGTFRVNVQGNILGHEEILQRMTFSVIMEKIDGKWYATDDFDYDPPIAGLPKRGS